MVGPLIDPESRWLEEPSADVAHRRIVARTVLVTPDVDITLRSVIKVAPDHCDEKRKKESHDGWQGSDVLIT